uniref:Hepcidin n=1 Tax=Fundulus heteroclitus TaxID=8078 RepID=A0A3Q2QHX5_FUNHE
MRTCSVLPTVILLLTFTCLDKISASPFITVRYKYLNSSFLTFTQMPFDIRENNYPVPIRCRFCCGCCLMSVCGLCCE